MILAMVMDATNSIQLAIAVFAGAPFIVAIIWWGFEIGIVVREFQPDGGKSIKDRIAKLEDADQEKLRRLAAIERKTDEQTTLLYALKGAVEKADHWNREKK